jgi:ribosomal protein L28
LIADVFVGMGFARSHSNDKTRHRFELLVLHPDEALAAKGL